MSVTHNAAQSNRPKRGLWNKLRTATALSKSADSSQLAPGARQIHHNHLSRSHTAGPIPSNNTTNHLDVNELKRQHLERAQYNMKQQQMQRRQERQGAAMEKYTKQQQPQHRTGRSDGSTDGGTNRRNSSTGRRSERIRGSPRRANNTLNHSDVMYSVMAEQPPPPPNRSFKSSNNSSRFTAPSDDLHGNPSWFSGDATQTMQQNSVNDRDGDAGMDYGYNTTGEECEGMYEHVGMYVDKSTDDSTVSTMSTMSTSRTNFSYPSTASSAKSTRSNRSASSNDKSSKAHNSKASIHDATDSSPITKRDVAIVYTSIQGSKSLWEACPDDMIEAQDVYDIIISRCFEDHNGCEISSFDNSSFRLVFQKPVDAVAFALDVQIKLYESTSWPEGIMNHDDAKHEPALRLKGLRVPIGMHCGSVGTVTNHSTGIIEYEHVGEVVETAKSLEDLCYGGQILTSSELWNSVCGTIEGGGCFVNHPQVMDLGEHFLFEVKNPNNGSTKKVCKRVFQLVPHDVSFDFGAARGRRVNESSEVTIKNGTNVYGRLFPPIISKKQVSNGVIHLSIYSLTLTQQLCFLRFCFGGS